MIALLAEVPPATADKLNGVERGLLGTRLDHKGKLHVAKGVTIVRPLRDIEPSSEDEQDAPLRAAFAPLAKIEAEQVALDDEQRKIRNSVDGDRNLLPGIAVRSEQLKLDHQRARGVARLAYIGLLDKE